MKIMLMETSLPVRGAWIEMALQLFASDWQQWSLPVRGAWIEIKISTMSFISCVLSLPVRGAWIEIQLQMFLAVIHLGRSPCGERGLKFPRGIGG